MYKNLMIFIVGLIISLSIVVFYQNTKSRYISFSDGAKYADIARNLVTNGEYKSSFLFSSFTEKSEKLFDAPVYWIPPVYPYILNISFRLFGITDYAVTWTTILFYILTVLLSIYIGKTIYGNLVGLFSGIAVSVSVPLLDFATSGAVESVLIFEVALGFVLFLRNTKLSNIAGMFLLLVIYLTRPQGFVYIIGLILFYLLNHYKPITAARIFLIGIVVGFAIDRLVLLPLTGKYFIYSVTGRGVGLIANYLSGVLPSDAQRGFIVVDINVLRMVKLFLYNTYNYYKLLPNIISPYLFTFFLISCLRWTNDKRIISFKMASGLMIVLTFLVSALTIPLYRYVYPVIFLVYIMAVDTMIWIVRLAISRLTKKVVKLNSVLTITTLLILFFIVGQTFGTIFLDSRYSVGEINKDKLPIRVKVSEYLQQITKPDDIVLTNLDTWGSWYGKRKTVWYPLNPNMIMPTKDEANPFDAIYLTSYLIDDVNYYMGNEWRQIFYNPENIENEYIRNTYKLEKIIEVPAEETYEKQAARAILLVRK